ncbi:uncharacterized protein LOC105850746 [Hydra vulgaris]|uniref:uncharacterized protein LOC105850746 n=1 Tax=Hydra vulgaris TaxID=6087 RepID=UPI0032EA4FF5
MDQDLMYLLTNQQNDDLLLALGKFSDNFKHNNFTFKVLVPKAILCLFAELEGISRYKAEVLLSSYSLQRTNKLVNKLSDEDDDFFLDGKLKQKVTVCENSVYADVIVDQKEKTKLFTAEHDLTKTKTKIMEKYYWPNISGDIIKWIKCDNSIPH